MNNRPIYIAVAFLSTLWIIAYYFPANNQFTATTENQPIKTIPIGYKFQQVGHDSVLIIKGKFVNELDGRVYVKVN